MAEKRLIWSPRASNELKDILEYYLNRNGSATYSLKLLETVDSMINLLLTHPYLGRKTTDDEARVISFGHFLLFYDENEMELKILSVWNNRQDPTKRIDTKKKKEISQPDLEIVSSRTFNFPQELVFRAWTEPEHLKVWWGPKGFTNTFHEFDLRPEGHWRLTMHGPDKGNYENHAVFEVIEKTSFISWYRISQPFFRVEVSFESIGEERTSVVFKMIFDDAKLCATIRGFAPEKNEENFDKLEVELGRMKAKAS